MGSIAAAVCLRLFACFLVCADFVKALSAYDDGEYRVAYSAWRRFAERRDAVGARVPVAAYLPAVFPAG